MILGTWLFILNNVNVSVEHYLFMFGTFPSGFFRKSLAISAQALRTDFYDMDSTVMQQHVSNCVSSNEQ